MILPIIIAFFAIIFLMVAHEFGHFIIAKKCGINVDEFGIGYPPRIFGKKIGKTLYSINWIPLGAFVKIPGEIGGLEEYGSFSSLPIWKRVFIVLGGVLSFWIVAAIVFVIAFNTGVKVPIGDQDAQGASGVSVQVINVAPNSPAQSAGIKIGDDIISAKYQANEMPINKMADFQNFVSKNQGKEIVLTIQREDKSFDISLTPRINPPANEGSVGVELERTAEIINKYPWYETPFRGIAYTGELTYTSTITLIDLLKNLVIGRGLPSNAEPTGPIGITVFLARAAELGAGFFLYFIGSISVLLAIFNLLPIPALDGGKILFLIIEKIKGSIVSPKIEQMITGIFFIILISLSLFITVKFDIPKLSEFIRMGG
jgi:regulator of sigma E protease